MQRAKMRKIGGLVKNAEIVGANTRVERAALSKVLRETYNEKTASRLNARLLRGEPQA